MREANRLARKFLTQAEQQEVTAAVQEMEQITSGEIVPMIVSRSHDYPMAAAACCISICLPLALLLTHEIGARIWIGPQNMWLFLGIVTTFYFLLYPVIIRSDRLKHFFLNHRQVKQEVERGALSAFYHEQLHHTRDANGILLYISVMEQMVWIVADKEINAKIDEQEWTSLIADLTSGLKGGPPGKAICQAVRRIGRKLHSHFPYKKDDTDELHNLIIR